MSLRLAYFQEAVQFNCSKVVGKSCRSPRNFQKFPHHDSLIARNHPPIYAENADGSDPVGTCINGGGP
jgi:hypothetical protein